MGSSTSGTPDPSTQGAGRGYAPNVNSPDPQQQQNAVPGLVNTSTVLPGSGIGVSNAGGDVTVTATSPGGVTQLTAGSGISVSNGGIGNTTVTNTGVTSLAVGNGLTKSAATGAVTLNAVALASAYELELTDTNLDTVTTYTPATAGVFMVKVYFRVTVATTTVTIQITYTDATGAQTSTPVNAVSETTGSYSLMPIVVACAAGDAITVSAQAGTANQVFVSASITP